YLEMVEMQLTQLSAMVERILSVSVEGHKERCNPTRMLLRPLLESLTAGLKLGFKKPLTIELNCSEEVWVVADRFHLKNTLATLIDNALKYSREELTLRLEASTEGNTTTIRVSDNGIGIAKEHLPYLFDKFYRVPTGDLQPSRGYGLGLYYARRVIELHGGTIEVKSRRMQGTTFTLKLPYDVC
ncbi:MAG: HAMP domain-containing histidine kinase, partial [Alistipes sp.]|nr:HAMP domain-containing histidine kinase [Alistipes sp.]